VQPLLDAVAAYLPSPLDIPPVEGTSADGKKREQRPPREDEPCCGLVFKIQADQHDELAFVRVYSGTLRPQSRVLNAGRNVKENVTRLWHIQADRRSKVDLVGAGDIVGIVGLKQSFTGDTLCDPKAPLVLERITFPETVISMSIEPESSADRQKLTDVLTLVQKEDPTFRVRVDRETGETLISGMGELHLEVVTERIRRDFRLQIRTSKPRVSYRETIRRAVVATGECHRQTASGSLFATVTVELAPPGTTDDDREPGPAAERTKEAFSFVNHCPPEALPAHLLTVVEEALKNECLAGGLYGFPLSGLRAVLCSAEYREGESNEQAYRFAVADAVRKGLEAGGVNILEPIMKLEVVTPEQYFGDVIADLGVRRAIIEDTGVRGVYRVITARAPLREMFGYSTTLRSVSQGRASYTMEPLGYEPAPDEVARKLV
jgi:elongation factor G